MILPKCQKLSNKPFGKNCFNKIYYTLPFLDDTELIPFFGNSGSSLWPHPQELLILIVVCL